MPFAMSLGLTFLLNILIGIPMSFAVTQCAVGRTLPQASLRHA